MTESEKLKFGLKEYDPTDEVGVRGVLTNQMGVKNDDIGWKDGGANGGTITVGGNDFMNINEGQLKNNSSFSSAGSLADAIKNFESSYGYDFNAKSDPTTRQFDDPYQSNLNTLYQQITDFDYDPESDSTYQAYKEQYENNGEKAMKDTMATASTLTGGRLNSYAQSAAQGAYDDYMGELSAMIPELESNELNQLYDLYNMNYNQSATEYSRFNDQRNFDYGVDRDNLSDQRYDTEWNYNVDRDEVSDDRYNTEWDHQLDREAVSDDQWQKSYNLSAYNTYNSGSSGSSSKDTTNPEGLSDGQIIANYQAMLTDFKQGGGAGSQAVEYIRTHYDELSERWGTAAVEMAINNYYGQTQPTPQMSLDDQETYEKIRGMKIDNDNASNPVVEKPESFGINDYIDRIESSSYIMDVYGNKTLDEDKVVAELDRLDQAGVSDEKLEELAKYYGIIFTP